MRVRLSLAGVLPAALLVPICAMASPAMSSEGASFAQMSDRQKLELLSERSSFWELGHDTELGRLFDDDRGRGDDGRGGDDDGRHIGPVPEPSTWLLMSGGAAVCVFIARRRRRK